MSTRSEILGFDIPVILRRAAIYAGVLLTVTAVYAALVLAARSWLRELGPLAGTYGELLFLAAAIPAFDPVKMRVGRLVDRILFPSRIEFSRVIAEVTRALPGLLRPDDIVSLLLKSAGEGLGLRCMYFLRHRWRILQQLPIRVAATGRHAGVAFRADPAANDPDLSRLAGAAGDCAFRN